MTAQIAIMNKNAVALATDSAVTTRNSRGVKVHNSANKLFTLSKYHPIGVMVYANAEFMGYPWETLIKVFRRSLGKQSFATVDEYAKAFFNFLLGQEGMFTAERQAEWFRLQASRILSIFNKSVADKVRAHIDQHGSIDEDMVSALLHQMMSEVEPALMQIPILPIYEKTDDRQRFSDEFGNLIDDVITEVFQSLPIAPIRDRLRALMLHRFLSDAAMDFSGVVFAGFGDVEMLPVVKSFWVDAVFGGVVRHSVHDRLSANLNLNPGSWIIPFAQSDTVNRFLRGIDPAYKREAEIHIQSLLSEVSRHVSGSTTGLYDGATSRKNAENALSEVLNQQTSLLQERLLLLERERFSGPVMDVIDSLPKDDLAAIAESFVNLTSFQRKILREVESVGGPIDAAVISKGDGFVWIKRKHYFDKDLNPAFFANYYRGNGDDD